MDIVARIESDFRSAIATTLGESFAGADPAIRPAQNPEFGDYQANAALALAKPTGFKPRDLAARLCEAVTPLLGELVEPLEVAGPGFINIRLRQATLERLLDAIDEPGLGVVPENRPHSIVIDLCGVNVAKQMHVGHLRATIIGDSLARVYERLGRTVHRENHLGDWGLPIAMVLHRLREQGVDLDRLTLSDLNRAYRDAQLEARSDERGLEAAKDTGAGPHRLIELEAQNAGAAEAEEGARNTLIRLQSSDEEILRDWHKLIDVTMREVFVAADILNVRLRPEHSRGESFYRDRLAGVVDAFVRAGLGVEDEGAIVVRFPDRERPLLIRKRDGGFLYATTDLAAVRYRVQELDGERVVYVVDARQRDHFRDVFDAAHLIGWDRLPDGTVAELVHIGFGAVLGADRRPLKTRSGENFTLMALLDEAVGRGVEEVRKRAADPESPTHGLSDGEIQRIGRAVGIAAVKYADLSTDLVRDYVFDLDRMIAFEGDTGPYLQYAHARICSIFARAGIEAGTSANTPFILAEPAERELALTLLRYPQTVSDVARTLEPHRLCNYLRALAGAFSAFYQACPVLKAEDPALRASRLRLSDLTRRALQDGLDLLGIEAPERM